MQRDTLRWMLHMPLGRRLVVSVWLFLVFVPSPQLLAAGEEFFLPVSRGSGAVASRLYRIAADGGSHELLLELQDAQFEMVATDPFGRVVILDIPPDPSHSLPRPGRILRWNGHSLETLASRLGDRPMSSVFTLDGRLIIGDAQRRLWEITDGRGARIVGDFLRFTGQIEDLDVVRAGPFRGNLLMGNADLRGRPLLVAEGTDGQWRMVKFLGVPPGSQRNVLCVAAFTDGTAVACVGDEILLYNEDLELVGSHNIRPLPGTQPYKLTLNRSERRYMLFQGIPAAPPQGIFPFEPNWTALPAIPNPGAPDGFDDIEKLSFTINPNFQDVFACREENRNHGAYVSCVARVTQGWVKEGRITRERRREFLVEAAHAAVGMPPTSRRPISTGDPAPLPPPRIRRR